MDIEKIITEATLQHEVHLKHILENFVGSRYLNLDRLIMNIEEKTKEKILLIKSEVETDFLSDFEMIGEIGNENPFSMFYLIDNRGFIYITEVSF